MNPLTPDKSRSAVVSCSLLVARCSFALFLIVLTGGCANNGGRESAPTLNPAPTGPSPAPVPAQRNLSLFGTVYEVTATGRAPVPGVVIEEMTCDAASPGCQVNTIQQTSTDSDGAYRITGLYLGRNNFVWIRKEGYEPVGRPAVPTCDNCNQIVEMNGDTHLDIELARR